jgi:hypothetical protein
MEQLGEIFLLKAEWVVGEREDAIAFMSAAVEKRIPLFDCITLPLIEGNVIVLMPHPRLLSLRLGQLHSTLAPPLL